MVRKRQGRKRREMLARNAEITSFALRVSAGAEERRGEEPEIESGARLELRGRLEEPVKGVEDVLISIYPQDKVQIGTARPPSVGVIIGLKPEMSVVLPWLDRDFDRLWALALAGRARFAYFCFTEPRYGKGFVVSASFSSEGEEAE